jgi:hypothetical protein
MKYTRKQLTTLLAILNKDLGLPETPWTPDEVGHTANVGHIYAEKALNGYQLLQMVNKGGAVRYVGSPVRVPVGEMCRKVYTMIDAVHIAKGTFTKTALHG